MTSEVETDRLIVKYMSKYVAESYSFRFDQPFGWAIFTINNSTGELSIQSDWGTWAYRWHLGGLPGKQSLKEFLASLSGRDSYVADKLMPSNDRRVIDGDATKCEFKKTILERRSQQEIDSDSARSAWKEIQIHLDYTSCNSIFHSISNELMKALGVEEIPDVNHFIHMRDSASYCMLRNELLPIFFATLRKEVKVS